MNPLESLVPNSLFRAFLLPQPHIISKQNNDVSRHDQATSAASHQQQAIAVDLLVSSRIESTIAPLQPPAAQIIAFIRWR
jgi:hypothetical protein